MPFTCSLRYLKKKIQIFLSSKLFKPKKDFNHAHSKKIIFVFTQVLNDEINTDGTSQSFHNKEHKVTEYIQEQDLLLQIQPKKRPLQKRNAIKSNATKLLKVNNSSDEEVSSSSSRFSNNEFSVFGQLVASQLAQVPLEDAIHLQQEILIKINESRLKHIRDSMNNSPL